MKADRYIEIIKTKLDQELFNHSLGVAEAAAKLAQRYGAATDSAYLAGIIHDYGKRFSGQELLKLAQEMNIRLDWITRQEKRLLHAPVGAALIRKELLIDDPDILKAVANHTTGCSGMSKLEKIVYLADYIETGRDYPEVEKIRQIALKDFELALLEAVEFAIRSVLDRKLLLHPDSVAFRNELLQLQKESVKP